MKGEHEMKFVHIADLHLGKVIHQYSLLEVQKELLDELLLYMDSHDLRVLIIAGDVYDRLIPSQEAVNVLDQFLSQAIQKYHIKVLMISGNHDSSDRMHFASSLLSDSGLYIETYLKEKMTYVDIEDVRFHLLPFVKPSQVKNLYHVEELQNYQAALSLYMSNQTIDTSKKNILVTHQFVGHNSLTSESELPLSVGGSEIIDASLFNDFDYVALGHLHASQKVSRETIRYSGSLMRYSFDEVNQKKSIVIVNTDDMSIDYEELKPRLNLEKYQGTFEQFMNPCFIDKKDDFLAFELEDTTLIPHAIDQLRVIYPRLLQITYSYMIKQQNQLHTHSIQTIEDVDTQTLFSKFYQEMKNQELSEQQLTVINELLEKVGDSYENS